MNDSLSRTLRRGSSGSDYDRRARRNPRELAGRDRLHRLLPLERALIARCGAPDDVQQTAGRVPRVSRSALFQPPAASAQPTLELRDFVVMPMTGLVDGKGSTICCCRGSIRCAKKSAAPSDCSSAISTDRSTSSTRTRRTFDGLPRLQRQRGKGGIFRKLTIQQGYGNGLNGFYLDPDYTRNGKFYTTHIEDPALPGSNLPDNTKCAGVERLRIHDDGGDQDARAAAERGRARRVDRFEPVELDLRGHGPRAAARAAEHPQPSAGRPDLQPGGASRRSRLARPLYRMRRRRVGRIDATSRSGPTRSGSTTSRARFFASSPTSTSTSRPARSARTAATGFPTTIRLSRRPARARRSGPTASAIRIG